MTRWFDNAARHVVLAVATLLLAPIVTHGQVSETVPVQNVPAAAAAPDAVATIHLARWDVLLNEGGMDPFDQLDRKPVDTASKVYQASTYNAAALRAAVIAAKGLGGLEGVNQQMAMSQDMGGQIRMWGNLYFGYYGDQQHKAGINGNANGEDEALTTTDKDVHLKFNFQDIHLQMHEPGGQWNQISEKPAIAFDGALKPGDAIAFRGALKAPSGTTYYHLVVWEAFRREARYQQNFQVMQSPDWWCELGPDGLRAAADVATVWASKAKQDGSKVSPKWERKLDDGKTLRLTGITRTDKWLFCWWDGDGQPLATSNTVGLSTYSRQTPIWFTVDVRGTPDEWKKQGPTGHGGRQEQQEQQNTGDFDSSSTFNTNDKGEAVVGVPIGDWAQVGQVTKNGTVRVGNISYRVRQTNANGDQGFYVYIQESGGNRGGADNGDMIAFTAVANDNTEIDPDYLQQIVGENNGMSMPQFNGMPLSKLKLFHVWRRKRQWVHFTDFAKEPTEPPPATVNPAELQAVAGQRDAQLQHEREQQAAKQLEAMKAKRAEWEAIPADPTTAKGALRAMFKAAAAGDLAAVRKRLRAKQADAGPTLDLMARYITAGQSVWTKATAKFGEVPVAALVIVDGQPTGLMDMEGQLMSMPWQPTADGGLTGPSPEMAVTKGDDGEYAMDMSGMMAQTQGREEMLKQVRPMAERMERVNEMLGKDPSMSLEQFKQALASKAPATQP